MLRVYSSSLLLVLVTGLPAVLFDVLLRRLMLSITLGQWLYVITVRDVSLRESLL